MIETWTDTVYHPPEARLSWTLEALLDCRLRYYSLARWALKDALRACGAGPGDKVLVPEFICKDLLGSIRQAGAEAVFYPVTERLELLIDEAALPVARAAIAVNFFGFPQDLEPFRKYCRRTGAFLIEDNAHGLFSRDEQGRWLGTRGDLGIFSLRKTMALPNGAALFVRALPDGEELGELPDPTLFLDANTPRLRAKKMFRALTNSWSAQATFSWLERMRGWRNRWTGNGHSALPLPDEAAGSEGGSKDEEQWIPGNPAPCLELSVALRAADPEIERERRRALYTLCQNALKIKGVRPVFPDLPPGVVPYCFPFYAEHESIAAVRGTLARHGLGLLPWPDLPRSVLPLAPWHYRNVWVVHFLV